MEGEAALLTTLSPEGFPHHSFLSEDEWAEAGAILRIALLRESRSFRNLRFRRLASFLTVADGQPVIYQIKRAGRACPLRTDPTRARVCLEIVTKFAAPRLPTENAHLTGSFSYERSEPREKSELRMKIREELSQ